MKKSKRDKFNFGLLVHSFLFFSIFFSNNIFSQHQKELKSEVVVFLGDSLTDGYGISRDQAFPHLLGEKINQLKIHQIKIINAGDSGSKSVSGLDRLKWIAKSKVSVLVLALGANDGLQGVKPAVMEKNLNEIIDFAFQKKMKVMLVGMKMPFNYGKVYQAEFENVFKNLNQKYKKLNQKFIYVPFLLESVAGVKELNLPDGIHPNEKGHIILTNNLFKPLLQLLNRK
jgi:acyl-CoA thioesterase-1